MANKAKQMLKEGKVTIGGWLTTSCAEVAEIMSWIGFDWIVADTEHGAIDIKDLQHIFQAISSTSQGTVPLVRVPWNDHVAVKRALETGAMGIVVPMVKTKKEAEAAVRAAKFPPEGVRGVGYGRSDRWDMCYSEYLKNANDDMLVVVQAEHIDAVKNIKDIVSIDGVDAVFVGPDDLAASLGIRGQTNDKKVQQAIEQVLKACKDAKKPAGCHVMTSDAANERIVQGFQFIALSLDMSFLIEGCQKALSAIKRA